MHKSIHWVCTRAKDPLGVYTEPCELQREGMVRSATCPLGAKRPWSQEMDETVMVDTSSAPVEGGRKEQDKIESVHALLDMTPQIMDCLRDRTEQDGVDRWACGRVRGSYSARVPRSSLAGVHREFVHHIVEEEVDGQEEKQDDRREDRQQEEERREVVENQTHNMSA